jgi:translation elongation factor EF-Tu-like GTPase
MSWFSKKRNDNSSVEGSKEVATEATDVRSLRQPNTASTGGFEMIIDDVFTIKGRGTIVTGKIKSGAVSVGDVIYANGAVIEVAGVEEFRKKLQSATVGQDVGLLVRMGSTAESLMRGTLLYK